MIENIFYILLTFVILYLGSRIIHMLIVSSLTADTVLDIFKNINIVPGKSKEALKAEKDNPFRHKIFFYILALCIIIILILSLIKN